MLETASKTDHYKDIISPYMLNKNKKIYKWMEEDKYVKHIFHMLELRSPLILHCFVAKTIIAMEIRSKEGNTPPPTSPPLLQTWKWIQRSVVFQTLHRSKYGKNCIQL